MTRGVRTVLRTGLVALVAGASLAGVGCSDGAAEDRAPSIPPPRLDPSAEPTPAAQMTPAPRRPAAPPQQVQEYDLDKLGYTVGSEDAEILVVEFSDFGCSYCRKFHEETYPVLIDRYVETGRILWRIIPFDVGMFPHAAEAAITGECAGEQDRFDQILLPLYQVQREWKGSDDPWPILNGAAREAGVDMARFQSCVSEGRRQERLDVANQLARYVGIRGTPTFFVEGFPVQGTLPTETFVEFLDRVLAEKAAAAG